MSGGERIYSNIYIYIIMQKSSPSVSGHCGMRSDLYRWRITKSERSFAATYDISAANFDGTAIDQPDGKRKVPGNYRITFDANGKRLIV